MDDIVDEALNLFHRSLDAPLRAYEDALMERLAPTPAQARAGNYEKRHVTVHGMPISIENEVGSTRTSHEMDAEGKPKWSQTMAHDYGYIRGTAGADKDHLDVFLSDDPDASDGVYIINQADEHGRFDEHKIMLGFTSEHAALKAYYQNYPPEHFDRVMSVKSMPVSVFKLWLQHGNKRIQAATDRDALATVHDDLAEAYLNGDIDDDAYEAAHAALGWDLDVEGVMADDDLDIEAGGLLDQLAPMGGSWDEDLHPRDDTGKFAKGGGGGEKKADEPPKVDAPAAEKPKSPAPDALRDSRFAEQDRKDAEARQRYADEQKNKQPVAPADREALQQRVAGLIEEGRMRDRRDEIARENFAAPAGPPKGESVPAAPEVGPTAAKPPEAVLNEVEKEHLAPAIAREAGGKTWHHDPAHAGTMRRAGEKAAFARKFNRAKRLGLPLPERPAWLSVNRADQRKGGPRLPQPAHPPADPKFIHPMTPRIEQAIDNLAKNIGMKRADNLDELDKLNDPLRRALNVDNLPGTTTQQREKDADSVSTQPMPAGRRIAFEPGDRAKLGNVPVRIEMRQGPGQWLVKRDDGIQHIVDELELDRDRARQPTMNEKPQTPAGGWPKDPDAELATFGKDEREKGSAKIPPPPANDATDVLVRPNGDIARARPGEGFDTAKRREAAEKEAKPAEHWNEGDKAVLHGKPVEVIGRNVRGDQILIKHEAAHLAGLRDMVNSAELQPREPEQAQPARKDGDRVWVQDAHGPEWKHAEVRAVRPDGRIEIERPNGQREVADADHVLTRRADGAPPKDPAAAPPKQDWKHGDIALDKDGRPVEIRIAAPDEHGDIFVRRLDVAEVGNRTRIPPADLKPADQAAKTPALGATPKGVHAGNRLALMLRENRAAAVPMKPAAVIAVWKHLEDIRDARANQVGEANADDEWKHAMPALMQKARDEEQDKAGVKGPLIRTMHPNAPAAPRVYHRWRSDPKHAGSRRAAALKAARHRKENARRRREGGGRARHQWPWERAEPARGAQRAPHPYSEHPNFPGMRGRPPQEHVVAVHADLDTKAVTPRKQLDEGGINPFKYKGAAGAHEALLKPVWGMDDHHPDLRAGIPLQNDHVHELAAQAVNDAMEKLVDMPVIAVRDIDAPPPNPNNLKDEDLKIGREGWIKDTDGKWKQGEIASIGGVLEYGHKLPTDGQVHIRLHEAQDDGATRTVDVKDVHALPDKMGVALVQEWRDGEKLINRGSHTFDHVRPDELADMALFDEITGNTDRHAENALVDGSGHTIAIDHGLAFPDGPLSPGGNFWAIEAQDRLQQSEINARGKAALDKLDTQREPLTKQLLKIGLTQGQVDHFWERVDICRKTGKVPTDYPRERLGW